MLGEGDLRQGRRLVRDDAHQGTPPGYFSQRIVNARKGRRLMRAHGVEVLAKGGVGVRDRRITMNAEFTGERLAHGRADPRPHHGISRGHHIDSTEGLVDTGENARG